MPFLPNLPAVLISAVLCTVAAKASAAAEPPQDADTLVACMGSKNFTASDDCATALTELSRRNASVSADGRVHRAFAARVHRDIEEFRDWQRAVAAMSEAELERESPEFEDGTSTMLLADTIRFQLLPCAGPDTEPVLFEALLAAAVMNGDMERGIARYGQRAAGTTLDFARSEVHDRRRIAYSVLGWMLEAHAGGSLASPLSSGDREAAARAITAGLQEAEPGLRIAAIRAAQRGRVQGALPMLRVLAVTEPKGGRNGIGQAAADAVASLSR
jgi:hypothetical protein